MQGCGFHILEFLYFVFEGVGIVEMSRCLRVEAVEEVEKVENFEKNCDRIETEKVLILWLIGLTK
jgi:hypothetical protein